VIAGRWAVAAGALGALTSGRRGGRQAALFALGLAATAFLLILARSSLRRRPFNSRMNTVFKLYYQAWLLLALAGGFALYHLWAAGVIRSVAPRVSDRMGALAASAACGTLYPVGATLNRTEHSSGRAASGCTRSPRATARRRLLRASTRGSR